jgi:hypothetical protein
MVVMLVLLLLAQTAPVPPQTSTPPIELSGWDWCVKDSAGKALTVDQSERCFRRSCRIKPIDACVDFMIQNEILVYLSGGQGVLRDLGLGSTWDEPPGIRKLRQARAQLGAQAETLPIEQVSLEQCSEVCGFDCAAPETDEAVCRVWPAGTELRRYKERRSFVVQAVIARIWNAYAKARR